MKTIYLSIAFSLLLKAGLAQTIPLDSLYLGQNLPGDSAIIFAPNIVSLDNRFEGEISFSPVGKECCFSTFDGVNWTWATILYANYKNNKWSSFKPAPFIDSTSYFDISPNYSSDSQKFVFSSARPSKEYAYVDLWICERAGESWGKPVKLPNTINNPNDDESYCSIVNNGNIYLNKDFTSAIWFSSFINGNYSQAVKVSEPVNSIYGAGHPCVALDESYMIFSSDRPCSSGLVDLYISYKKADNSWTNPKNLGPKINSADRDGQPTMSPDGKYLFFVRSIKNKYIDIYCVKASFIDSLRKTNFEPWLKAQIPNQTDSVGHSFSFTIPDTIFIDDDGNNTLTYSATLSDGNSLPSWLTFEPSTRTFSGTPIEIGTFNMKAIATDTAKTSVSCTFAIRIITNPKK
jgi:hypothetical protein